MRVLPYNIFYMLRLFPVLESEGLVWVLESLGIRLVSIVVTQDGLSLPVSVWNRTHNGGWQEYSRAWRLWFWVYKCGSQSHLNLALYSLETTQNLVKDQSKQIEQLTSTFKDQLQQLSDQSQQLNDQLQQLNDQSQQLNDQSRQIERLVAKNTEQSQQIARLMAKDMNYSQKNERLMSSLNDQSQQIASLTSTVQGLVQQVERLTGQDRYQAVLMDKTTDQTKDQTNVKGTINANVKEGIFL